MRPAIRFLSDELIRRIVSEATDILCTLGVEIHNKTVLAMLSDCGCRVDMGKFHAVLTEKTIAVTLKTAPESFGFYDVAGKYLRQLSPFSQFSLRDQARRDRRLHNRVL